MGWLYMFSYICSDSMHSQSISFPLNHYLGTHLLYWPCVLKRLTGISEEPNYKNNIINEESKITMIVSTQSIEFMPYTLLWQNIHMLNIPTLQVHGCRFFQPVSRADFYIQITYNTDTYLYPDLYFIHNLQWLRGSTMCHI